MSFRLDIDDGRFARTLEVKEGRRLTVGTASGCGLRLESKGVARHHATFRMSGRHVVVEVLGLQRGVHVAGRRVRAASLQVGDEVRVGRARLRLRDVLPEAATADEHAEPRSGRARRSATAAIATSVIVHAGLLAGLGLWTLRVVTEHHGRAVDDGGIFVVTPIFAGEPDEVPGTDPGGTDVAAGPEVPTPPPVEEPPPVPTPEPPVAQVEPTPEPPRTARRPEIRKLPAQPEPSAVEPPVEEPAGSSDPGPAGTIGVGTGTPSGAGEEGNGVGARGFGKDEADVGNRIAAGLLQDGAGGGVLRGVRGGAKPSNVWVVRGDYDQAEKTLKELGIDHAVIAKDALETRAIPPTVKVLVYNCTGRPMSREAQARVAAWVRQGGWLISTDWGVERLIEHGLPDTLIPLRSGERPVLTKDETVSVRASSGQGLAEGLSQDGTARWWLEDSSVPFTVAAGVNAEILVRSDDLENRHGQGAAGVAVTFPYGKGHVLHLLGHLYQQEGNVKGALLVHRLLVNTLAVALK